MSCIVFDHVNKSFQGKQVLKDVSFTVRDGDLFGLLGPSGAGKTTILNILTGRLHPDGGHTSLWQKDCTKLDAATLGKIGTVLDQDGLYDRLSCYDNLLLYAQLHGVSSQKIIPVLAKVQLQDSAKKPYGISPRVCGSVWSLPEPFFTSQICSSWMSLQAAWIQQPRRRSIVSLSNFRTKERPSF